MDDGEPDRADGTAAFGFPLDPATSFLSELAALDQPTSVPFRMLDAAGLGMIVAAVIGLVRSRQRAQGGWVWMGRIAVGVSILASAVVAVQVLVSASGQLLWSTGIVQRMQTMAFCLLLIAVVPVIRRAVRA